MLKYGLKINGVELSGVVNDVEVTLTKLPEVTLPRDSFRVDEFIDEGSRQDRYIKKTERDTGRIVVEIHTQRVTGQGRSIFEEQVILPLTQQVMARVELEETEGLIYVCTYSGNILKRNVAGKSGVFKYALEFNIEWIERRVLREGPLVDIEYLLDPNRSYYVTYRTDTYNNEFKYTLKRGTEETVPRNFIHRFYGEDSPYVDEVLINTLTQTVTSNGRVVGIFTEPVPIITGYDSINIFRWNSGGYITIWEVV